MASASASTRRAGRPSSRRNPRRSRAPNLKRSYQVDISDESDVQDDLTSEESEQELDSDSAAHSDDGVGSRRRNLRDRSRPKRRSRSSVKFHPGVKVVASPVAKARPMTPQKRNVISLKSPNSTPSQRGTKRPAARSSERTPSSAKQRKVVSDLVPRGFIPNWLSPAIPYSAWADIFMYAASEGSFDNLDTNWLIRAATTCKVFTEPALAGLYYSPRIRTPAKAKRLLAVLELQSSDTSINYRYKVETLFLDIQVVPSAIIADVVRLLPRLKELIFFTKFDQPPYRELDRTVRWTYPEDVFQALQAPTVETQNQVTSPTILKSWEWSQSLMGEHVAGIQDIVRIHQTAPFSHLTRLSFTNFQVPSLHIPLPPDDDEEGHKRIFEADGVVIDAIAQAIAQIPTVKHLVFESSTVMNDRLLPLLPTNLLHLDLINCWEVKSDDLTAFLHTHGRKLRTLSLLHNQSLDLAYLTQLSDTCPNLEVLRMNLSYYRLHETVDDSRPMYDKALLPEQVPQWPASLRVLDIEHVRDWEQETAEMFLQSLIDQAANLPALRYIVVKTILDIPWQARAALRAEWREKMERVFLRPFTPPRTSTSLRQPVEEASASSPARKKRQHESPSRRSTRIASDSERRRGSRGLRHRGRQLYREPDTDEDEFDQADESDDDIDVDRSSSEDAQQDNDEGSPSEQTFIHGMCTTVSITFDNQKVRELQYSMEDFEDSVDTTEDEWDGDFEEDDPVAF